MQTILLAAGLACGLFLAYVDSLPRWDDSGVLAGGLLLASGLVALLGFRRPWLLALAVGIWIPLRDIYLTHDLRMLFVLAFAFAGAYAGWGLRRLFRAVSHGA